MEKMYEDRKAYKKKMLEAKKLYEETKDPKYKRDVSRYHNLQLAKKIQLNSAFGALANEYFRWFANYLAEAVTASGQMSTMWTEIGVNQFMNKVLQTEGVDYVIAADTDSLYLNVAPLNRKVVPGAKPEVLIDFMTRACDEKVIDVIKKRCKELTDMVGCPTCKLNMKRESIADKGIWTAKKKYLLNVWDSEGVRYKEPEIKVTGIEAVRSSTPMVCRDKIKEALKIFINADESALQDFIAEYREEFFTKPFHEIASPRGISGLDKYRDSANVYSKGTPIQVRGALLFNKLVTDLKLGDKYPLIYDGTKIKFCYLKLPNPIRENVIAVPETLPPEFELEAFIDYELQYEKAFVAPLMIIANAIGWKTEKSSSLLDLI
jgi:DNA polymerase elongation subunit (family B)